MKRTYYAIRDAITGKDLGGDEYAGVGNALAAALSASRAVKGPVTLSGPEGFIAVVNGFHY